MPLIELKVPLIELNALFFLHYGKLIERKLNKLKFNFEAY